MNAPFLAHLSTTTTLANIKPYLTPESYAKLASIKNPAKLAKGILRFDLVSFMIWGMGLLNPGKAILDGWHIEHLCYQLLEMQRGGFRRGLFAIPPRYGKTTMLSVLWHAWLIGHDPAVRIIAVSYSQDIAEKFASMFRTVVEHEHFKALFPGFVIAKSTANELTTDKLGGRFATSVDGPLTGIGAQWITVDDPLKAKDADSELKLLGVREWMQNTLFTRLDNKQTGRIIVTHQRLALLDPIGFLAASGGWTLISLAAIAETAATYRLARLEGYIEHHRKIGDALHPALEPIEVLQQIRSDLGSKVFNAQYQQRPEATGNALINLDWLQRAEQMPAFDFLVMSIDPAMSTNAGADYSVIMLLGFHGRRSYVWHVERKKLSYPDLRHRILSLADHCKVDVILVEKSGVGFALWQELAQMNFDGKIPQKVTSLAATTSKVSRVIEVLPAYEKGEVWIPKYAKWLDDFINELLQFPNGLNDDQVDALTQALRYRWELIDLAKMASVHKEDRQRHFSYWGGKIKPV